MEKTDLIHHGERLDSLDLNGLMLIQNPREYLFTSDAVELANFAKCRRGATVVELCSGSGVIGILINEKFAPKHIHMVELQPQLVDMCRRSLEYNGISEKFTLHNRRLQGISQELGVGFADIVVVNPPYKASNNKLGDKHSINIAKHEIEVTLDEIIAESERLLKFGGTLYLVNKTERLVDIFMAMRAHRIEPKAIKFLSNSVLVAGVNGGKSGLKIIKE